MTPERLAELRRLADNRHVCPEADLAFAIAARSAVPELISRVEELERRFAEAVRLCEEHGEDPYDNCGTLASKIKALGGDK